MRRILATFLLALTHAFAHAGISAPADWRTETFTFPLAFAPTIAYQGTEHVRFAPYWDEFAGERGFTYAILWDIERRVLEPADIERALRVYFDGLMEQVTRVRGIKDPGSVTTSASNPLATPEGWEAASSGRVWTWNGFSKGEPLVLHFEVTQRGCGAERTQVVFLFSRAERSRPTWKELRDIRTATTC